MIEGQSCIYCGTPVEIGRGEGDHIIPAGLGEFRGDVRFRRICTACNNDIGRSEQQFLHCGPAGFFRHLIKPAVPNSRRRGRSRVGGAMGAPAPGFTVDRGDHRVQVQPFPNDPQSVRPVDQVVIQDDSGREASIALYPGMRVQQLQQRLAAAGISKIARGWLHGDIGHYDEYLKLVKCICPAANIEERAPTPAGAERVSGRVNLKVNNHYFRAVAKIAFHYYLRHTRRGYHGDEMIFADIRRFIMHGGERDRFFRASGRAIAIPFGQLPSGGLFCPRDWSHVLAADETEERAVVLVLMFLGPGCVPKPHYVTLGAFENKIILPSGLWGHIYFYEEPQPPSGYAGHVEEASFVPIPRLPV